MTDMTLGEDRDQTLTVQEALALGRLPERMLPMPTQRLERPAGRVAQWRDVLFGAARAART